MTETPDLLQRLLLRTREAIKARERAKEAIKSAAAARRLEVSDLDWPVDDPDHWQPFRCRHLYERQLCDCCGGESVVFHQELTGFRAIHRPTTIRWLRHRGEAFDHSLPVECEIFERRIPRCWDCQTLDRLTEHLWK